MWAAAAPAVARSHGASILQAANGDRDQLGRCMAMDFPSLTPTGKISPKYTAKISAVSPLGEEKQPYGFRLIRLPIFPEEAASTARANGAGWGWSSWEDFSASGSRVAVLVDFGLGAMAREARKLVWLLVASACPISRRVQGTTWMSLTTVVLKGRRLQTRML